MFAWLKGQYLRKENKGAYHLAEKIGKFRFEVKCKVLFRKCRSEIVEYLQWYSSFSIGNGTAEKSIPFERVLRFQAFAAQFADETPLIRLVGRIQKISYHYAMVTPTGIFLQMVSTPRINYVRVGQISNALHLFHLQYYIRGKVAPPFT